MNTGRYSVLAAAMIAAASGLTAMSGVPAAAQDHPSIFNAGWDDPNWVIESEQAHGTQTAAPVHTGSTATSGDDGAIRLGGSQVRFESVDGAPGATLTPQGGAVSLGVGLTPATAEIDPVAGFGALPPSEKPVPGLDSGVAGAISFSDTRGAVTQTMSLSAPLVEGGGSDPVSGSQDSAFKTMFGLGYNF